MTDPITPEREHGDWDKTQQRYEDGCKHDAPSHATPGRATPANHEHGTGGPASCLTCHPVRVSLQKHLSTPERVTLTEAERARIQNAVLSGVGLADDPANAQKLIEAVERILSARAEQAERQVREIREGIEALADELWRVGETEDVLALVGKFRALSGVSGPTTEAGDE